MTLFNEVFIVLDFDIHFSFILESRTTITYSMETLTK